MDSYAYLKIENLKKYLDDNNIEIPGLHELRLMKDQESVSKEEIEKEAETYFRWYIYPKAKSFNDLHGKKRKMYKLILKRIKKRYDIFNKYVGKNVICAHAELGKANLNFYGRNKFTKHPLYLERVDDYFDPTYCDIYFKIKENNYYD